MIKSYTTYCIEQLNKQKLISKMLKNLKSSTYLVEKNKNLNKKYNFNFGANAQKYCHLL